MPNRQRPSRGSSLGDNAAFWSESLRTALRLAALTAIVVCCTSCERTPNRLSAASSTNADDASPRAVIEQLITTRQQGLYQPMDELVVPGRAYEVTDTLLAVDEFLAANRVLCDYVRHEFTLGLSESIDQSSWGSHLDIFSQYVELIEERIEANGATVAYMVDGQVPVRRAHLTRVDGRWRYDPGPGYDPQLPAAFRRMARGLRQVLDDLKSGHLPADAIRTDPERLVEEVRVRLLPGIRMLPRPTTQPGDD